MAYTFVLLAALAAVAQAGVISAPAVVAPGAPLSYASPVAKFAAPVAYAAPVAKAVVDADYDPNPSYSYAYDITDHLTGDSKSQQESRQGDAVQGSYSLIEPDGTKRIVEYTADPVNGFNAVVHKEPAAAPVVAKVAAPVAYAAPVAKIAAPLAYLATLLTVALAMVNAGLLPAPVYHAPAYPAPAYHAPAYPAPAYPAPAYHAPAPVVKYAKPAVPVPVYPDAHPHYTFEYSVADAHTGDTKSQHESRDGDAVQGVYSLIEPDGTKRTVEYTADDHNGFNAVVHKEGTPVVPKYAPPPPPHVVPVIPKIPVVPVVKYAAPAYKPYHG
ncbi:uncharacterized protein LOC142328337 [Lycorma delicatula]|uniref:uncharacterized protein LOC142328337 n=1 Tax=Lycorma delicatula TaxID=130591 RepID=UPI003F518FAE